MSNLEAARKRGRESYAKYQKPKRQCDEAMRVREALERKARRDKKKANAEVTGAFRRPVD